MQGWLQGKFLETGHIYTNRVVSYSNITVTVVCILYNLQLMLSDIIVTKISH